MTTEERAIAALARVEADRALHTCPDHPWQPGEHTRYVGCARHAGALARMDFDDAVDYALVCEDCVVEFRPRSDGVTA